MKSIIKKLLREGLINERLTNVEIDVDLIYNTYFKNIIDEIQETGILPDKIFTSTQISTSILKSEKSIESHKLNPCVININHNLGNFYNPSRQVIGISLSVQAIDYIKQFKGNINKAMFNLDDSQKNNLGNEFKPSRIKGSIHHELVHWIDDTLNNNHIKKFTNRASEIGDINKIKGPINSTKLEIQAQIHNIKQLYNHNTKIWDKLTFIEMINKNPSLNHIFKSLDIKTRKQWVKDIKTRMHREGLLGKNMVNT
tara:strand:+ start:177 stop:941 length:765 start_codon:yes stop_codon:yes gene_type:complete